jgi:hypothetical protein
MIIIHIAQLLFLVVYNLPTRLDEVFESLFVVSSNQNFHADDQG